MARPTKNSLPEIVEPSELEPIADEPTPEPVTNMTLTEAKRAAPTLGMLILKGFNIEDLKSLGVDVSGSGSVDVGRGLMMMAAGAAHATMRKCAERLDDLGDVAEFVSVADVQSQFVGHMIRAAETLAKPDTRPTPAASDALALPSYDEPPVHQHVHFHS